MQTRKVTSGKAISKALIQQLELNLDTFDSLRIDDSIKIETQSQSSFPPLKENRRYTISGEWLPGYFDERTEIITIEKDQSGE